MTVQWGKCPRGITSVAALLLFSLGLIGFAVAKGPSTGNDVRNVTELAVNGIWSAPKDNGVDLDGLRLMTRPEGIDGWTAGKRQQWLTGSGYDLSVDINEKGVWLHAVETNLMVIPNERWEDSNLSWIRDILQPGALSSPLVFWELPPGLVPVTFAFRTRNGTAGIFRVTAYSQEKRQATIHVKLDE